MTHPVLTTGSTAVITGGASGIGLTTAKRLAVLGMNVVLADLGADRLAAAADAVRAAAPGAEVMTSETDVSSPSALTALDAAVTARFGGTDVLMNNAAIQSGSSLFGPQEVWDRVIAVNLWGEKCKSLLEWYSFYRCQWQYVYQPAQYAKCR